MLQEDGRVPSLPTRASIEAAPREDIHRGAWSKADIYLVETGHGPIVIKDFASKRAPIRWFGRLQNSRECAAYRALQGVLGIAAWYGRIDAHALAMEKLEGIPLRKYRKDDSRQELLASLRAILDNVHRRGVIHNDLRGSDNTLVRSDGRVVLIDFAGAFLFRPGSFWHRLLFRRLSRVDEAAYLKWKRILDPDAITPEEEKFLRRFAVFRRFWVFNLKGALR